MLRWKTSWKQKRKDDHQRTNTPNKKSSWSYLRISKDINDLSIPMTCAIDFPTADDLFNFKLTITPDEGFFKDYGIAFSFAVGQNYPYEPPKVKCLTEIYHPNIDLEGNVCLNILREDWKPVLTINSIVYGLQFLLLEPNPEDPLNETAATQLKMDSKGFASNVRRVMAKEIRAADVRALSHSLKFRQVD
ncbi:nedd8-conjugating enzyme UbcE2M-like [Uloborus diversus]|uniref:nedd8-conjugating enzyme UbcE2M-like n=1 Tax=Uloborus diversus TaxID=327109 RepID=UPI00240A2F8A|nr:nedd8-conjugating enzyme UbcE2M-like [Uloborus diversus]